MILTDVVQGMCVLLLLLLFIGHPLKNINIKVTIKDSTCIKCEENTKELRG